MEQLKLNNGYTYDLPVGGIFAISDDKIQITIRESSGTFSEIESMFENEYNTQKIKIIGSDGNTMTTKEGYTVLKSITKQHNYVTGSEEYINEDGEVSYRDTTDTVYIITLSKPDLYWQLKNLQETVDMLVLESLEE